MQMYSKPIKVKDINEEKINFPFTGRMPEWLKKYQLLIKTRRRNKYYIVEGTSYCGRFYVIGFDKFKVIGWKN